MNNACLYLMLLEIGAKLILIKNKNKHNVMLGGLYSSKIIDNIFIMKHIKSEWFKYAYALPKVLKKSLKKHLIF